MIFHDSILNSIIAKNFNSIDDVDLSRHCVTLLLVKLMKEVDVVVLTFSPDCAPYFLVIKNEQNDVKREVRYNR